MFASIRKSKSQLGAVAALAALLLVGGCGGTPQQRAKSYYDQGAKLLSQKEYVKAGVEFKNAIQMNGALVDAWRGLAEVAEQQKNLREVPGILRKIVELDPKDVTATLKLARFMMLANRIDDSLKLANTALALEPRNVDAMVLKAGALLRQNDNAAALKEAQQALEIAPDNVGSLMVLAAEKASRGDNQGALEMLDRGKGSDTNFGVQFFKIQLFEKMGNLQQVESLIRKLVDLYPKEPVFRQQLVKLYAGQKRMDDAEKELRAIAEIDPSNVQTSLDVVRFLNTTRGADAAKQELLIKIKAGGKVFPYEIALAEFEAGLGQTDDSIHLLEKLIKEEKAPDNVLAAQAKLGELYYAMKNYDAAEALVTDILRKDSRSISGLKLRAMIRMERRQLAAAIIDLRQALNDQPRAVDLMMLLALAYERNGSIDLADKQYSEATRASNLNPEVGLNYVAFLQRRGGGNRVEDILAELATRWPNNAQILSALANVKLARKDYIGAEEIAVSLRKLGSTSQGIADQILSESLSGRNKLDQSIEILQTAHDQAPTAIQPIATLVRALIRAKQIDRALAVIQNTLEKEPNNASLLVLLGSTQFVNNAPQDALASFKAAIDKQPKNVLGYQAMANLLFQQKKAQDAMAAVASGLNELPGNYTLRLIQAGGYELLHDYESAIKEYEELLKEQPGSMVVANNLASLLTDYRTDKASYDRAFSLISGLQKSQVPFFKDTIGWVYYRRGDFKAAVSQLEQASTELPNVAMVRYHLGESYIAVGQNGKAAEQLNQALSLAANDNETQEMVRNAMKRAGIH